MKTPPLHARRELHKAMPRPRARALEHLKVFIAYADLAAARRATATIADAIGAARRRVEVQPMLWRFHQLESSYWQDRAVTAALEADIVVLASSARGMYSHLIERWIEQFLAASRGRHATIVALAGEGEAWTVSIDQPQAGPCSPPEMELASTRLPTE